MTAIGSGGKDRWGRRRARSRREHELMNRLLSSMGSPGARCNPDEGAASRLFPPAIPETGGKRRPDTAAAHTCQPARTLMLPAAAHRQSQQRRTLLPEVE